MKRRIAKLAALLLCCLSGQSCADLLTRDGCGTLVVRFAPNASTKTGDIPDTDDFILTVTDSGGDVIYEGSYGESPEEFNVSPGSYTVSAISREFAEPLFEAPQYGDTRVVYVPSGGFADIVLECVQLNSGIRLLPDATFRTAFPNADIFIKGSGGSLMYGYSEKRTAYFRPGSIGVLLKDGQEDMVICTRELKPRDILTLKLAAAEGSGTRSGRISVTVDTSRTRTEDGFTYGDSGDPGTPYSVTEAREHIGEKDVWVEGYLVGVATGTSKFSFEAPFGKNTNVILGVRKNTTDKDYCMTVELPKGNIRDALNLVDNPDLLGRRIAVRGTVASAYFGIPGLKSPDKYEIR